MAASIISMVGRCRIAIAAVVIAASMTVACKQAEIRQPAGQPGRATVDLAAYDVLGLTRAKVCWGTEMQGYETFDQAAEGHIPSGTILIQASPGAAPSLSLDEKIVAGYVQVITLGAVDLEEIILAQRRADTEASPLITSLAWDLEYGSVGPAVIVAAYSALAKVEGADAFVISRVSATSRWFIFPFSSCADVSGVALRIKPAAQAARAR